MKMFFNFKVIRTGADCISTQLKYRKEKLSKGLCDQQKHHLVFEKVVDKKRCNAQRQLLNIFQQFITIMYKTIYQNKATWMYFSYCRYIFSKIEVCVVEVLDDPKNKNHTIQIKMLKQ